MLQVIDLAKSHGVDLLFEGVTFNLQPGQKMALLGRNGSGKSTLMNILAGHDAADEGRVRWARGARVSYLDQHRHFTNSTVLEEVVHALPESYHGLSYKAEEILEGLGMAEGLWSVDPTQLSGGYRLRLALAVLLAEEPDCLLLDEPTNHLDLPSVMWLTKFLKSWPCSAIFISHDRSFLDSVCDVTAGIYTSKFFYVRGDIEQYFTHLMMLQQASQAASQKREKYFAKQKQFIDRFRAKATKAAQVQSRQKMLDKLPGIQEWVIANQIEIDLQSMDRPIDRLVHVQELEFQYHEDIPLIGPVDLEWGGVDRLAFVGANGCGKSTLLKLVMGYLEPNKGFVQRHNRAKIGYFGQRSIEELDVDQSPVQCLMQLAGRAIAEQKARASLGAFGITSTMQDRKIGSLSGGERSRVVLALISLERTHGLILDEPTHHLDVETVESLMQALSCYEGSVILVTHSENVLQAFNPDQLLVFQAGEQTWYRGGYESWLQSQKEEPIQLKEAIKAVSKNVDYERQKELKREHGACERKIAIAHEKSTALQKEMNVLYDKLAEVHAEQDLNQASLIHAQLKSLEKKYEEELKKWFEHAQMLEQLEHALKK